MIKHAILFVVLLIITPFFVWAHGNDSGHDHWQPKAYPQMQIHAPTPMPDRVVLTWASDPATSQSVTWRTDDTILAGVAEIAIANANGRALKPVRFNAQTTPFTSDINVAHYHSLTFENLTPDTLYVYRVGDGVNWSEYFHFRTASDHAKPFSFIYFGDAQNDLKTHWSRVFREAFRDAPRAAFTLHAGDLINEDAYDAEWGEWHSAPAWVNGTLPVIATPGNHEYFRANRGPVKERLWLNKAGIPIEVDTEVVQEKKADGTKLYKVMVKTASGDSAYLEYDGDEVITLVGDGIKSITGFTATQLLGTIYDKKPLNDRRRDNGIPKVSTHWCPQFAFPEQDVPKGLEETTYYIDYQGVRFISLDSNRNRAEQVPWLRKVLTKNPNRWTILTFHHPIFSPAKDRDNQELRELWKPVFDEFKVDLVLTGHDHTYSRTGDIGNSVDTANIPTGYQQAYDPKIGTVYVVSVSGPKMYNITKGDYAKRVAEDTQLYQIIEIDDGKLFYKAFTATGDLYDAFTLEKQAGKANRLKETLTAEIRKSRN